MQSSWRSDLHASICSFYCNWCLRDRWGTMLVNMLKKTTANDWELTVTFWDRTSGKQEARENGMKEQTVPG